MVSPTGWNTLIKVTEILQVFSLLPPDGLLQFFCTALTLIYNFEGPWHALCDYSQG